MSESSQEPTMEEILASIRRIISEDDEAPEAKPAAKAETPAEPEPPAAAAEAPEPEPEPVAISQDDDEEDEDEDDDDDDALELTEKVETHGDLDVYTPPPAAEPAPQPVTTPASSLVSAPAAAAAAAAFGRLTSATVMPAPGNTLEDLVREMLRPMLQQWLDENLAGIVQKAVDAEVARIARGS